MQGSAAKAQEVPAAADAVVHPAAGAPERESSKREEITGPGKPTDGLEDALSGLSLKEGQKDYQQAQHATETAQAPGQQPPQPEKAPGLQPPQPEKAPGQKPPAEPAPAQAPEELTLPLLFSSPDLEGIAQLIREGKATRIICMCGAGISVSAGIPDFRTPGSGLYSQLQKYHLGRPEDIFDIHFFRDNPKPFHMLAKELFPGQYRPTPTHFFMRLLHEKGLLLRCYTQNIDSLESEAGLPRDMMVAAHGNFDSAHCVGCDREYPTSLFKASVDKDQICRCPACKDLIKPDIVFFGEALPDRFDELARQDFPQCDLLIVMGTSLVVHPFAGLISDVGPTVPRLLINREAVGQHRRGFDFAPATNTRDALHLGDCDSGVKELAAQLGWRRELELLVANGHRPKNKRRLARFFGRFFGWLTRR